MKIHYYFIQMVLEFGIILEPYTFLINGAVAPPPWADPKINPCASQPRGWQLLYWPPDGKCYKIFKMGYPCPDDMELSPAPVKKGVQKFSAECRCPPKTAQSTRDGRCYELFTSGPCETGYYFAPDTNHSNNSTSKNRQGTCREMQQCTRANEIFWPLKEQCYEMLSRGPCPRGQLLTLGANNISTCKCNENDMTEYFFPGYGCFQHFTKGPCREIGHLFLPNQTCGCHNYLPHYYKDTQQCFEIGSLGPCSVGEQFQLDHTKQKGTCLCKPGHIRYDQDGTCYRPYTQGPCADKEILVNATTCIKQPCQRGHLYFPEKEKCFKIGSQGPCPEGQVVTFDFETRPSIDGISYNGLCSCEKSRTCIEVPSVTCKSSSMVFFKGKCYKLYTQGPCAKGAWLTPKRHKKEEIWTDDNRRDGVCECMPSYTKTIWTLNNKLIVECLPPTVMLADYLNKYYASLNQSSEA